MWRRSCSAASSQSDGRMPCSVWAYRMISASDSRPNAMYGLSSMSTGLRLFATVSVNPEGVAAPATSVALTPPLRASNHASRSVDRTKNLEASIIARKYFQCSAAVLDQKIHTVAVQVVTLEPDTGFVYDHEAGDFFQGDTVRIAHRSSSTRAIRRSTYASTSS